MNSKKKPRSTKKMSGNTEPEKLIKVLKEGGLELPNINRLNTQFFHDNFLTEPISFSSTPDLTALLYAQAKSERRSVSNTVGGILVQGFKSMGLLDDTANFTDEAKKLITGL